MSDEAKLKYKKRYDEEFEQYKQEMKVFLEKHPELEEQFGEDSALPSNKQSLSRKLAASVKKPKTPFQLFYEAKLSELVGQDEGGQNLPLPDDVVLKEFKDDCRSKWVALKDKKRLKWIRRAVKDVERFETEIEQFRVEKPQLAEKLLPVGSVAMPSLTLPEVTLWQKSMGRPETPIKTGYLLFSHENHKQFEGEAFQVRNQKVVAMWKALDDSVKNEYKARAAENQRLYKEQLQEYLDGLDERTRAQELQREKRPSESANNKENKVLSALMKETENDEETKDGFDKESSLEIAKSYYELIEVNHLRSCSEHAKKSRQELLKMASDKWNAMPPAEQANYIPLARSIQGFASDNSHDQNNDVISPNGKKRKAEPKDPVRKNASLVFTKLGVSNVIHSYSMFSNVMMKQDAIKAMPIRDKMAFISSNWKKQSPEVKNKFDLAAKNYKERYSQDMKNYLEVSSFNQRIATKC